MATPPTSNSSAGNTVRKEQRIGNSGAMTQNPQNTAPSVTTPTLSSVAGAFGPSPGVATNILLASTGTTPPLPISALTANGASTSDSDPLVNELMKYPTYTYALSFEVATPTKANNLFAAEKYEASDWIPLIKTGGLGKEKPTGTNGEKYFKSDFYIDNLRLKTLVGMNPLSRATNVISIDFTITEPYGVSFIEQLFDFVTVGLQQKNYLEMCYLLKIDFIAYDDSGTSYVLDHHRKYIPIRLINITFTITAAGAVYEVEAIPFNHTAFGDKIGFVPKDTQLEGKTLNDFVSDILPHGLAKSVTANQDTQRTTGLIEHPDVYKIEFVPTKLDNAENFTNGTNLIDIGKSPMVWPRNNELKATPMINIGEAKQRQAEVAKGSAKSYQQAQLLGTPDNPAAKGIGKITIEHDKQTVVLNGGSAIADVLENLIKGSTYITDQMEEYEQKIIKLYGKDGKLTPTDEEVDKELNYPIKWFKIIPSVTFLNNAAAFDKRRNCYPKEITYKVVPYLVYSNKLSIAPSQIPGDNRIVKKYNYIYTGKNTEILNFEIKFDLSFFHMLQFNASTQAIGDGKDSPSLPTSDISPPAAATESNAMSAALSQQPVANTSAAVTGPGIDTKSRARAGDVASSLYNPGDLVVIELDILGDPDYIKQDDIFYKPAKAANGDPYISPVQIQGEANGSKPRSFGYDSGEIYFRFTFFTPTDYNLDSGLMEINRNEDSNEFKRSMFSGLYRVISAESTFSGGTFKQKLEAYRLAEEIITKKKQQ